MQANVIVLSAPKGMAQLTYDVPGPLAGIVQVGHRVLVPLRGRKMTAVVVGLGEQLAPDGSALKPLLEFLASYYLVPLSDAYRMVIPAALRVETRTRFKLARPPDPLELVSFNDVERMIVEGLAKRPMTARQLASLAGQREITAAVSALSAHGVLERQASTRGRHREPGITFVRLTEGTKPAETIRGTRRKSILAFLEAAPNGCASMPELQSRIPGAKAAIRA